MKNKRESRCPLRKTIIKAKLSVTILNDINKPGFRLGKMFNLEGDIASLAPLFIVGIAVVLFLGIELLRSKPNAKEPPLVHSTIPFIGHIIGLVRRGTQYYATAG
jgi:hypothetical protein